MPHGGFHNNIYVMVQRESFLPTYHKSCYGDAGTVR
jgi:hypothetical protein